MTSIGTLAISGFEPVLLYTSDRDVKASFIFDKTFYSQKQDLLSPRISNFIQKIFFGSGEHHDRQNPGWKSFQILERTVSIWGMNIAIISQIFLKE
jgi:hypothetical protein